MGKFKKFKEIWQFENPIELLCGLILFKKTSTLTYRYKGVTALVDHGSGDQDGVRSCLVPGLYSAFYETMGKDITERPITFLDLGANTGGFPLSLLAAGATITKGVCVELNPITCTRLSWNLAQNHLFTTVSVINGALCGENAPLSVQLTAGSVSDSIFTDSPGSTQFTVEGSTLDRLIEQNFKDNDQIDICKIDVEGAEYEAFSSSEKLSLKRCNWIVIEIHERTNHSAEDVRQALDFLEFIEVVPVEKPVEQNVFLFKNLQY